MALRTVRPLRWLGDSLWILDQTRLPTEVRYRALRSVEGVAEAIERLRVRGAPAIGIAAAYGVVLAVLRSRASSAADLQRDVDAAVERLSATRPTARNLFWALERMHRKAREHAGASRLELRDALLEEAHRIRREDSDACHAMGRLGAELLPEHCTVITHCNAGALATAEFGTAVGVIYAAAEQGKQVRVFVDETRPLLQGARLTVWELMHAGIDATLICDNAAAFVMQRNPIHAVLVGADRIARNGDVANKVGTYNLAVLAKEHGIPFYVVAPSSTFDLGIPGGEHIPIEERAPEEVTHGFGRQTAPSGAKVYNPAFDVTPARLVTAIVSEKGIIHPPYEQNIPRVLGAEGTD